MLMEPSLTGALAFALLGAALVIPSVRLTHSVVSPPSLYGLLWCGTLALYYSGVVLYYPIRAQTLLIFVAATIAFVVGGWLASSGRQQATACGHERPEHARALRALILVVFALGLLGTVLYYQRLHSLIGIQSLWRNPVLVRLEESTRLAQLGWIAALRSMLLPAFVLAMLGSRHLPSELRRGLGWIAAVCVPLVLPSSGRTILITLITWAVLALLYSAEVQGERRPVRRHARFLALLMVVALAYFFAVGLVLNKALGQHYDINEVSRLPPVLNGIVDILHYQLAPVPSFQQLLDATPEFEQRGSLTFGVVSRVLAGIAPDRFAAPEYVQPFVFVPLASNLYTYLDAFYLDFGWYGILVFPLAFGWLSTWTYFWMRRNAGMLRIYVAAVVGVAVLQSTGVNRFGNLQTWFWLVVPLALAAALAWVFESLPLSSRAAAPQRVQ